MIKLIQFSSDPLTASLYYFIHVTYPIEIPNYKNIIILSLLKMLERLNQHKTRKDFTRYEASVNELYKMFCEMNNKIINEITVFERLKN